MSKALARIRYDDYLVTSMMMTLVGVGLVHKPYWGSGSDQETWGLQRRSWLVFAKQLMLAEALDEMAGEGPKVERWR